MLRGRGVAGRDGGRGRVFMHRAGAGPHHGRYMGHRDGVAARGGWGCGQCKWAVDVLVSCRSRFALIFGACVASGGIAAPRTAPIARHIAYNSLQPPTFYISPPPPPAQGGSGQHGPIVGGWRRRERLRSWSCIFFWRIRAARQITWGFMGLRRGRGPGAGGSLKESDYSKITLS